MFTVYNAGFESITLVLLIVKGSRYLQAWRPLAARYTAMISVAQMLVRFFIIFAHIIISFVIAGHLLFGFKVSDFRSMLSSSYAVMGLVMGRFEVAENLVAFDGERSFAGRMYVFILLVVAYLTTMSLIIALFCSAWEDSTEALARRREQKRELRTLDKLQHDLQEYNSLKTILADATDRDVVEMADMHLASAQEIEKKASSSYACGGVLLRRSFSRRTRVRDAIAQARGAFARRTTRNAKGGVKGQYGAASPPRSKSGRTQVREQAERSWAPAALRPAGSPEPFLRLSTNAPGDDLEDAGAAHAPRRGIGRCSPLLRVGALIAKTKRISAGGAESHRGTDDEVAMDSCRGPPPSNETLRDMGVLAADPGSMWVKSPARPSRDTALAQATDKHTDEAYPVGCDVAELATGSVPVDLSALASSSCSLGLSKKRVSFSCFDGMTVDLESGNGTSRHDEDPRSALCSGASSSSAPCDLVGQRPRVRARKRSVVESAIDSVASHARDALQAIEDTLDLPTMQTEEPPPRSLDVASYQDDERDSAKIGTARRAARASLHGIWDAMADIDGRTSAADILSDED